MSKTLTIRYTSDTHGYLYPTSYADMQDRPMGLMKLASEYPHDGNTLIIDGGDTIQGSPLTNLYQRLSPEEKAACLTEDTYGTHPIAAMMNLAGYQFVTLGNHDFNYGVDALLDYLTNLDALCLCANIRDKEGRLPIAPYAVHQLENGPARRSGRRMYALRPPLGEPQNGRAARHRRTCARRQSRAGSREAAVRSHRADLSRRI